MTNCLHLYSNTMASGVHANKRLGTDLSVNGNSKRQYHSLYSHEENAHLKAMCAEYACLFHEVIPIISLQGPRQNKGGMCRDFSCTHGIALNALLRTECKITSDRHEKERLSTERFKSGRKHSRVMAEIASYHDARHLINPFVMYWLANFGARARPSTQRGVEFDKVHCLTWARPSSKS